MSIAKEFFEKVAADTSLQARYTEIINSEKGKDATYKRLIDLAKDAGYNVSLDEITDLFKELSKSDAEALSDSELELVAAGKMLTKVHICKLSRSVIQPLPCR